MRELAQDLGHALRKLGNPGFAAIGVFRRSLASGFWPYTFRVWRVESRSMVALDMSKEPR
jgi:hypothetical protein